MSIECSTLVNLLRRRALRQPERRAYLFLPDGETEELSLTYGELDAQARAIGAQLQRLQAQGERVLLLYPPGPEYVAAFFGCLYAGSVAVPAYPPRFHRTLSKLRAIAGDARPAVALTTSNILYRAGSLLAEAPDLHCMRWLTTDNTEGPAGEKWVVPDIDSESLALLQYTSGSTALPKGVMVSHGNLLHNQEMIRTAIRQTEDSVFLSWLPLYHDMGLIGNMIQTLYLGATCILMSPSAFLLKPVRWLRAVSRYRATTSGGPNFAYDLCARKITTEQRRELDLGSWEIAFNGAEPVRHETLDRFAAAFEPCGFRREAFYPCYGLAEATLLVSGAGLDNRPVLHTVKRSQLEHDRVVDYDATAPAADYPADKEDACVLVSCGQAFLDQKILIVDPETMTACAPDRVGEIWVSGPSVARGYWNRPEESSRTFDAYLADTGEGPFLRTGDLGFLRNGDLFVTGRLKDLIIITGRNHYPQDIECTVEKSHPLLKANCSAAFSVEVAGEERLAVVAEIERPRQTGLKPHLLAAHLHTEEHLLLKVEEVQRAVRSAVAEHHEVQVHALVLLKAGTLPKTSSGKVQRHACRDAFLKGTLEEFRRVGHEQYG
ncbi:MAG TPA: fatty acyl-AMP ligase [Pyrinomonadaceae bacterium]|jgi:acyl-CoA synthetase (AMP-forming)/AMP-acid ligase II